MYLFKKRQNFEGITPKNYTFYSKKRENRCFKRASTENNPGLLLSND